ncbi:MAG: methyl-accepting chemotaxis protein [Deltaproteobacteria bacterium]
MTYKRNLRNYLTNKDLQLRLIRNNLFYLLLCVIVTVGILLYPLIYDMMFLPDLESQYQAAQTFLLLVKWLVPAILIVLILFMGHTIIITHRICGPLVNFTNAFDRLAQGDLTRKVYIRKGDYLRSECNRINIMIDGISGILNRLFTNHNQLLVTLQSLDEQEKDAQIKEKLASSLSIIRQDVKYVSDTLSKFKVSTEKTRDEKNGF